MLTQRAHPGWARMLVAHHSVEAHLLGDVALPPYRLLVDGGGGHWEPAERARPFDWPSGTRTCPDGRIAGARQKARIRGGAESARARPAAFLSSTRSDVRCPC